MRDYNVDTSEGRSMKTKLISIGNSKGIRIPAPLIREAGLDDEIDLEVEKDGLKIRPAKRLRQGWEATFSAENPEEADNLLIDIEAANDFDDEEWTW